MLSLDVCYIFEIQLMSIQRFELQHVKWNDPFYPGKSDIYREIVSVLLEFNVLFYDLGV